jgi:hypothetical protein
MRKRQEEGEQGATKSKHYICRPGPISVAIATQCPDSTRSNTVILTRSSHPFSCRTSQWIYVIAFIKGGFARVVSSHNTLDRSQKSLEPILAQSCNFDLSSTDN